MRFLYLPFALAIFAFCAQADDTVRNTVWSGFDTWLTQDNNGFSVRATDTTDWVGFVAEGNRIRGEKTGDSFAYRFDRAGTYYLGLILTDDPDGVEQLAVALNGVPLGTIAADQNGGRALYSFATPIDAKQGDRLTFTCETPVGYYRVYKLVFSKRPIIAPLPEFEYIEPWPMEPGKVELCWTTTLPAPTGHVEYGVNDFASSTPINEYKGRNHRVTLTGLAPDQTYQARIVTTARDTDVLSKPFTFLARPATPPATQAQFIPISVPEPANTPRHAWPATVGMPFAQGVLRDTRDLRLFDASGKPVLLQADCTCRWPDQSVKWATLTFLTDSATGNAASSHRLEARPDWPDAGPAADALAQVAESPEGWNIHAGRLAFRVRRDAPALFDQTGIDLNNDGAIAADEVQASTGEGTNLEIVTGDGKALTCGPVQQFTVEENGPCRAVFTWNGSMEDAGWGYIVRATLWRGQPRMRLTISIFNDQTEPAFRALKSVSVHVPAEDGALQGAVEGRPLAPVSAEHSLRVVQDREDKFTVTEDAETITGERAIGVATVAGTHTRTTVFMRDFRDMYPSGMDVRPDGIHVDLLPALPKDAYSDDESTKRYSLCYAWFKDGTYLFRAGQMLQREIDVAFGPAGGDYNPVQYAAWFGAPLIPLAPPATLCDTGVLGRPLFARTLGIWDAYDTNFDQAAEEMNADRDNTHYYGWMNFGDWYGERTYNSGNNEYDLAWTMAVQWMRTGDRRRFQRGIEMARHYATVDTLHGAPALAAKCRVWTHSFNHVGTDRSAEDLHMDAGGVAYASSAGYYRGAADPQGHIYEEGIWLYGTLTGDAFLRGTADQVSSHLAESLTPNFDFEIERGGGWPLINMTAAYKFTGNPYYLNAARIMVQRCLERHDPVSGCWPQTPPLGETNGVPVVGGKPFAVGILTCGLLRYLELEPMDRPDVRHMLVRSVDWLKDAAWVPGKGFVYITNVPSYVNDANRGYVSCLCADAVAFAYEETKDPKYLDFWKDMMAGVFDGPGGGMGKGFSQNFRQSIFGLERLRAAGVTQ